MSRITPINEFFGSVAQRGLALLGLSDSAPEADVSNIVELCSRLLSSKGDASGLALSFRILQGYEHLDENQKIEFFKAVSEEFQVDKNRAVDAAQAFLEKNTAESLQSLSKAASPRYSRLINRLNQVPAATMQLVQMRSDLLNILKSEPDLKYLDQAFVEVFYAWFNRAFLGLRILDWSTGGSILENIIKYEAVHGISGWEDLARRIKPKDRLIYGFFHRNLGDEPLIFVEVALTKEMPSSIGPILSENRTPIDPEEATTAVFYSISNCQNGLRGIPLGNFLIKQVVENLKQRYPGLKDFVTLSPIVKLGDYLRSSDQYKSDLPQDLETIIESLPEPSGKAQKQTEIQTRLLAAAASFLTQVKAPDGKPVDPVCRFHIGNGARLERLNWAGHLNEKGFRNSYTIMANYRYIFDDIEKNHEAYIHDGTVATSAGLRKLLAKSGQK